MSLAALGCNPEHKGASLEDIGGASLGQLGFSPDGGMYIAIRAGGAISRYEACFIGGGLRCRAEWYSHESAGRADVHPTDRARRQ